MVGATGRRASQEAALASLVGSIAVRQVIQDEGCVHQGLPPQGAGRRCREEHDQRHLAEGADVPLGDGVQRRSVRRGERLTDTVAASEFDDAKVHLEVGPVVEVQG